MSGQESLARDTIRGVGWVGSAHALVQILSVLRAIALARLLSPGDFGVFAIVLSLSQLFRLLGGGGLVTALVQRHPLTEAHTHSAFWLQVGLSMAAGGGLAATAGPAADFFDESSLVGFLLMTALAIALTSASAVPDAMLRRALRFKPLAAIELLAFGLASATALAMAASGSGTAALVASYIVSLMVSSIGIWLAAGYRPRLRGSRAAARDLAGFGGPVLGFNLSNFALRHGDNIVVGGLLGSAALGIYSRGYQFLLFPLRGIAGVVGQVMLPALSLMREDPGRARRAYLHALGAVSLMTFPVCIGIFLVADDLVTALLGTAWAPAVPVIRLFAVAGLVESTTFPMNWIYQSQGRPGLQLVVGLATGIPFLGLAALAASLTGEETGVASTYLALGVLLWYPLVAIPGRLIGVRPVKVAAACMPAAFASAVMAGTVVAIAVALRDASTSLRLAATLGVGIAVYLSLVLLLRPESYLALRRAMASQSGPTR